MKIPLDKRGIFLYILYQWRPKGWIGVSKNRPVNSGQISPPRGPSMNITVPKFYQFVKNYFALNNKNISGQLWSLDPLFQHINKSGHYHDY